MKITLFLFFIGLMTISFSQKHGMNWYFGTKAGLSFKTYPPTPLVNGAIVQREGNATISDAMGNLLFYTDGTFVWNKQHQKMANGTGLLGQQTAAQSCIIAKQPQHDNIYFLFTVSDWQNSSGSLSYSIVDISKENGLGAVTNKNILINANCREQISAVYANENGDVWILSHEKNTNSFVNYKLTKNGLETNPVISQIGSIFTGKNRYGQLKFSADGSKVCSTLGGNSKTTVELFDFNAITGKLSNGIVLSKEDIGNAYSSEFSPNGQVLYVAAFNESNLFQFDLSLANEKEIQNSRLNLSKNSDIKSCLQIGYDHKIYVSKYMKSELGVIHEPNKIGIDCNFEEAGVKFSAGSRSRLGFPNFIQSYFKNYISLDDVQIQDTIKKINSTENILDEKTFIIYFNTGSSSIDSKNAKILDELVTELNKNPGFQVLISSHTDCTGKASSNLNLSQKRANSTADYLNKKMESNRFTGMGFGEAKPLTGCECDNCTSEENSLNRRTEIKLIPIEK